MGKITHKTILAVDKWELLTPNHKVKQGRRFGSLLAAYQAPLISIFRISRCDENTKHWFCWCLGCRTRSQFDFSYPVFYEVRRINNKSEARPCGSSPSPTWSTAVPPLCLQEYATCSLSDHTGRPRAHCRSGFTPFWVSNPSCSLLPSTDAELCYRYQVALNVTFNAAL